MVPLLLSQQTSVLLPAMFLLGASNEASTMPKELTMHSTRWRRLLIQLLYDRSLSTASISIRLVAQSTVHCGIRPPSTVPAMLYKRLWRR